MAMPRAYCIAASAVLTLIPSLAFAQGTEATPPPEAAPPPDPAVAGQPPPPPAAPPPMARPPEPEEPRPAPNSVFAEGLGAGLAYSINYERRVIDALGVRVGFSYLSFSASAVGPNGQVSESSAALVTLPVTVSYLGLRGGKHALEVGGGGTFVYAGGSGSSIGLSSEGSGATGYGNIMLGYRLHPVGGAGFQFRIGMMALIGPGLNVFGDDKLAVGVLPWGYISFGAGF